MKRQVYKNERGFAVFEAVAFLFCFIVLTAYVVDFFTAIHTGIISSIGARSYLLGTLQHRANISWLRQKDTDGPYRERTFILEHERFHGTVDEDSPDGSKIHPATRVLTQVKEDDQGQSGQKTSSINIKTGYGICIDSQCAADGGGS